MALSASTMSTTIITQMDSFYGPPVDPAATAERKKFADAMAAALLTILTVQTTVTVTSVTGVTPGPGASGPGVGVIS